MIIITLGSNVASRWGDPATTIRRAVRVLDSRGVIVLRCSALYLTTPYGITDQPPFVNAAAAVRTALPPAALLSLLKKIEAESGRSRSRRWGPRALDIDIIDYNARILNWPKRNSQHHKYGTPRVILPHPEIQSRPFVVRPMMDIAPYWHHPVTGRSAMQLMARLRIRKAGRILGVINR
jgi:2-amino-4-hydroxy-6-hydroxymethyldihydropteridine diphosphokinase